MALSALQSAPLLTWFKLVNDTVTEPYLDEVFHVRQAQHYCRNDFHVWDPKITTPPGLYLLSYLASPIVGCDLVWLRLLNLFCITTIQAVVTWTYYLRRPQSTDKWSAQHSALNVTLFPPLFFFAALYYTDVPSTLSVLIYYWLFLHFNRSQSSSWLRIPVLSLVGISSLLFRQTNVFWVAIFPAGLALVNELDQTGHEAVKDSMQRHAQQFGDTIFNVARSSWKLETIYDARVRDSGISDYMKTLASLLACTLKILTQPKRLYSVLLTLGPSFIILSTFTTFVLLNGSVALGDKSNHIPTLHPTQLLYLWPALTLFSWPLTYPYLATIPFGFFAKLPNITTLESMLMFKRRGLIPRVWLLVTLSLLACVAVALGTIVHPFTLADNRHYTFYVFRLLLRPWWVRYAVTPVYVLCGWACMQALGARPLDIQAKVERKQDSKSSGKKLPKETAPKAKPPALPDGTNGATTSFVLVWLATSTLQLITAPLVEPRYFILPWVFWRIHVPLQQPSSDDQKNGEKGKGMWEQMKSVDHRLWLETAWMLLVNGMAGYVFLYRGFEWVQEPGKVQRFMW